MISVPKSRLGKVIGDIGEAIIEQYFDENDIIILAREYALPGLHGIVDFVISTDSKGLDKWANHRNMWMLFEDYLKQHPESLNAKFKGEDRFTQFREFKQAILDENPFTFFHYVDELGTLLAYDITALEAKRVDFVKRNFCLVEVKASLGNRYPKKRTSMTRAQKEHEYYDVMLRVKINPDISNGFKGTINVEDLARLHEILNEM